jgi:hypothetical protein
MTINFHNVFTGILAKRMGLSNLAPVFPGFALDETKRLNAFAVLARLYLF